MHQRLLFNMPQSAKIYVRHRRDKRLYDNYLRHVTRPEWRTSTSLKAQPDSPLSEPSFGSAVGWIRKHRHLINTLILLLKLYPHLIRDDSLNSLWEFLRPYLDQSASSAYHSRRRTSSDSDVSISEQSMRSIRSTVSTPQFVEISFPIRTMSTDNVRSTTYNRELRSSRSATAVHKVTRSSHTPHHRHHLSPDMAHLPRLTPPTPPKSRNSVYGDPGYASPSLYPEPNRLAPPPQTDLSPVSRYLHHNDSRPSPSETPTADDPDARPPLPPVKHSQIKHKLEHQWSIDGSTSTINERAIGNNESAGKYQDDLFDVDDLDSNFYKETTYLVSRKNSLNDVCVEIVHWPPRKEELNKSSNNNGSHEEEESEVSYPLHNSFIDINVWSDTPIEGVEGELE